MTVQDNDNLVQLGENLASALGKLMALATRHYGPGPHPGTGTPQSVHGSGAPAAAVAPESFYKEQRLLADYLTETYREVSDPTPTTWMSPDGKMYDVGSRGHHKAAVMAFGDTGLWDQEQVESDLQLGTHGQKEFVEYGFVRIVSSRIAKELAFQMSAPDELTEAQKDRLAKLALKAYANNWRVIAEPSTRRLDLPSRYNEEDIRSFLDIIERHYGPGPHPGTGTPQSVHGSGGGPIEGFFNNTTASYAGQINGTLIAYGSDYRTIGHVDWTLFQGKVHIAMIWVDEKHRRKGVATALWKRLKEEFPDSEIATGGYATAEGQAFVESLAQRHYGPGPHPGTGTPQDVHGSGNDHPETFFDFVRLGDNNLSNLVSKFAGRPVEHRREKIGRSEGHDIRVSKITDDQGNELTVQWGSKVEKGQRMIWLSFIKSNNPGTGLGTAWMNSMKWMADQYRMSIEILFVTNPDFYQQLGWMKQVDWENENTGISAELWQAARHWIYEPL